MDYRLHRNCICRNSDNTSAYSGLGLRRFFRIGPTSEEIKNIIKREAGTDTSELETDNLSTELSKEDILDARGKRNFHGMYRGGRMGNGKNRGRF